MEEVPTTSSFNREQLIGELLLSESYLQSHGFPFSDTTEVTSIISTSAWRQRSSSKPASWELYGLDCEMCETDRGLEAVWVALVGEDGSTVLDLRCRPQGAVLDAHTRFHGLDRLELEMGPVSVEEARLLLVEALPANAVIAGSALHGDMSVLGIAHPWYVDTTTLYPACPVEPCGKSETDPGSSSLQALSLHVLGEVVQIGPHSAVQDARASLRLVLRKLRCLEHLRARWHSPAMSGEVSLTQVLRGLELNPSRVLSMHMWGSRVYGCADPTSDFDFICVVDVPSDLLVYDIVCDSAGLLNALLIDEPSFRAEIHQHRIYMLALAHNPPECTFLCKVDMDFRIRKDQLRVAVLHEASITWNKGKRQYVTKGERKGKKRLVAAIRYLMLGTQLAHQAKISDWRCANEFLSTELASSGDTLDECLHRLRPHYDAHVKEFQAVCGSPPSLYGVSSRTATMLRCRKEAQLQVCCGLSLHGEANLYTQSFIERLGVSALTANLGILVQRTNNAVHLMHTGASPRAHPVVSECRGLVLHAETLSPLALPPLRILEARDIEAPALDFAKCVCSVSYDGLQTTLYRHDDRWEVSTLSSADGSEKLGWKRPDHAVPFRHVFWDVWASQGFSLPDSSIHEGWSFTFCLITPRHSLTIPVHEEMLVFVGSRHLGGESHRDELESIAGMYGWLCAPLIDGVSSLSEAQCAADRLEDPADGLIFAHGEHRVSVKRRFLQLVAAGVTTFGDSPRPLLRSSIARPSDLHGDRKASPTLAGRLLLWDALRTGASWELCAVWPAFGDAMDALRSDMLRMAKALFLAHCKLKQDAAVTEQGARRKCYAVLVDKFVSGLGGAPDRRTRLQGLLFRLLDLHISFQVMTPVLVWLQLAALDARDFVTLLDVFEEEGVSILPVSVVSHGDAGVARDALLADELWSSVIDYVHRSGA